MPQLGETVTEGTITRWAKNVGDNVAEDEVLFEVSTDKVDSEVPSPASGVLSEILVQEGDTVDVGTKLAVISDSGSAPAPKKEEQAAAQKEEEKEPESAEPAPTKSTPAPAAEEAPAPATPAPQKPAPAASAQPSSSAQPPAAASSGTSAAAAPSEPANRVPSAASGGSKVLSPVVRRLIGEHNLDPDQIQGTGAGGRITRSDVLDVIDRLGGNGNGAQAATPPAAGAPADGGAAAHSAPTAPASAPAARAAGSGEAAAAQPPAVAGERDEVVPFTNIRRRTAEHMVMSKHTSAHTVVAVEVDYSGVEKVRAAQKSQFKADEGFGLTYLPFISRATIDALREWPHLNSSVGDDQLVVHKDVNLGIAVDLDFEGLLVPVIHGADGKRLRQIAREVSELARKARGKKLTMDDISGGTFTITNPGPFGTLMTVPVINQPQVAILSTDGVTRKPVAVELPDGSYGVAVHPVGNLVMVWDHRAVDGAYASAFLHHVKEILETRDWAAEL